VKVKLIPNVPETLVVGYDNVVKVRDLGTVKFTECLYELLVRSSCLSVFQEDCPQKMFKNFRYLSWVLSSVHRSRNLIKIVDAFQYSTMDKLVVCFPFSH